MTETEKGYTEAFRLDLTQAGILLYLRDAEAKERFLVLVDHGIYYLVDHPGLELVTDNPS